MKDEREKLKTPIVQNGCGVWWNVRDPVTGKIITKSRRFESMEGVRAFMQRQREVNPWIDSVIIGQTRVHKLEEDKELFYCADREDTDAKNRARVVALMLEHGIVIPSREWDKWRPTDLKTGHIAGVATGLTCILTDGLQAHFIREDREPLCGHVQCFKWDVPDISFVPYIKDGEVRFFKQVKDTGAPSAYFKRLPRESAPKSTEPKARKKVGKITTKSAAAQVDKLLEQYKNLLK